MSTTTTETPATTGAPAQLTTENQIPNGVDAIERPWVKDVEAIPKSASKPLYCLTIMTIRKEGMSQEAFGKYLNEVHGPRSADTLARFGMVRWSTSHNTDATRAMLPRIYGEGFDIAKKSVPYDCFSQAMFEDVERVREMTEDAYYKRFVKGDPAEFANIAETK